VDRPSLLAKTHGKGKRGSSHSESWLSVDENRASRLRQHGRARGGGRYRSISGARWQRDWRHQLGGALLFAQLELISGTRSVSASVDRAVYVAVCIQREASDSKAVEVGIAPAALIPRRPEYTSEIGAKSQKHWSGDENEDNHSFVSCVCWTGRDAVRYRPGSCECPCGCDWTLQGWDLLHRDE